MKSDKSILIAFILNLAFSVFEFVGGVLTGSVAIISDAVHDVGDAVSIGISYFLERKSKKQPDESYTYGYAKYSVFGALITTLILLVGSALVVYNALHRIIFPREIDYDGMIVFAVIGVVVNLFAALLTHKGHSLNQKAVNLHMLEDVLGWLVVLVGAVVMRFTGFALLDPILSIGVAVFIFVSAAKSLRRILNPLLEKAPNGISVQRVKDHILRVEGVLDIHHIHLWSLDGHRNYATVHVVTDSDAHTVKAQIREELKELGIEHSTIELELPGETCFELVCHTEHAHTCKHSHHHH